MRRLSMLCLLGLGACTSVLGIEDLHEGPRPGSGGIGATSSGGTETTGGGSSGKSGTGTGGNGTGGKISGGGTPSTTAGDGPADAGNGPSGGTDTLGGMSNEAGAGGAPEPAVGTVKGKVIDRWGVPVGNVPVQIGTTQATTDDNGAFTIDDVTATYDVSLFVLGDGWVFQDLTRRNPTLQVYQGHPNHYTYVDVTSGQAVKDTNDQLSLAAGTATGSKEYADIGIDSSVSLSPEWDGPTSTTSTIHGLEWTKNAATELPVSYKAYDSKPLPLAASVDGMITLAMAPKTITSKAITGSVTARATQIGGGARNNSVFVRFGSGASIQVVDHTPTTPAFSYVVPTLADSSVTFAAWEGTYEGPLGMVHRDGLSPGAVIDPVAIPAPPGTLTLSGGFSNVDEKTTFSFKASADNAGPFVVILNSLDTGSHLYIVTSRQKIVGLPNVVDGAWFLEHASGTATATQYEWWVETHGAFANVDDMTGPAGYVDEFSQKYITPVGTSQKDGTYTYSALYRFSTKNQ